MTLVVLYILSDTELSDNFQEFFKKHAKNSGKNTGGLILNESDNSYFEYVKISNCNIVDFENSLLVYEDREFKKCYYFKTKKEIEFYKALKDIGKSINSNESILSSYSSEKLQGLIDALDNELVSEFKEEFSELFDFLLSKF